MRAFDSKVQQSCSSWSTMRGWPFRAPACNEQGWQDSYACTTSVLHRFPRGPILAEVRGGSRESGAFVFLGDSVPAWVKTFPAIYVGEFSIYKGPAGRRVEMEVLIVSLWVRPSNCAMK